MPKPRPIDVNFKSVLTDGGLDFEKMKALGESEKMLLIYNLYRYERDKFMNRSLAMKGKPKSEEHKHKIAASMKGNRNAKKGVNYVDENK